MLLNPWYHTAKEGPQARGGCHGNHVYSRHCCGSLQDQSTGELRCASDQPDWSANDPWDISIELRCLRHWIRRFACWISGCRSRRRDSWSTRRRRLVVHLHGSSASVAGGRYRSSLGQLGPAECYHSRQGGCVGNGTSGRDHAREFSVRVQRSSVWHRTSNRKRPSWYGQAGVDSSEAMTWA